MKFLVSENQYWYESEECDTLEQARETAEGWANDLAADEAYGTKVTISLVVPVECFEVSKPERAVITKKACTPGC